MILEHCIWLVGNEGKNVKNLAKEHKIDIPTFSKIVYAYRIETKDQEGIPSKTYIKAKLGDMSYVEPSGKMREGWEKLYSKPLVFNNEEEFTVAKNRAEQLFPSHVVTYVNDDNKNVLVVHKPVEKLDIKHQKDFESWKEYNDYLLIYGEAIPENQRDKEERKIGPQKFQFNDGIEITTSFKPNSQQEVALNTMSDFVKSNETSMTLSGYAGTGKTSLMEMLAKKLKKNHIPVIFSASTNKAAAVLKNKVKEAGFTAKTLNKIFGITVAVDETQAYDASNLKNKPKPIEELNIASGSVVVIDEASMINEENYAILNDIAKQLGLKIIYVGDKGQLAPVKETKISKVFRDANGKVVSLTKVERTEDNAILKEATAIRNGESLSGESSFNKEGKGVAYIKPSDKDGIKAIVEKFVPHLKENPDFFRIIAYTNQAVSKYNIAVRKALGYTDNTPHIGEPIVGYSNWGYVRGAKNDTTYRFVNSEAYKVANVGEPRKVTKRLSDGRIIPMQAIPVTIEDAMGESQEILMMDIKDNEENKANARILAEEKSRLWNLANQNIGKSGQAYRDAANDIEKFLFVNDNITEGTRSLQNKVFDFGYAMTAHKSQGSTFTHVLVDDVDITTAKNDVNLENLPNVDLGLEKFDNFENQDITAFNQSEGGEDFLKDVETLPITASTINKAADNVPNKRQQLEYVAVSRATDTVTIISNNVKKEDTPLNHIKQPISSTTTVSQPTAIENTPKPADQMNRRELWEHLESLAEPMGERPISYTPVGKTRQQYIVKDGKVYNKKGEEVHYQGKDMNRILANLAIAEDRGVVVTYKDKDYVVDNHQNITSVTSGDIMKWGPENGDRKAIIQLAEQKFKTLIENRQNRLSEMVPELMDLLKAQDINIHDKAAMEKFLKENPQWATKIQQFIGKKARTQFEQQLMKARPDLATPAYTVKGIDFIKDPFSDDFIPNRMDAATAQALLKEGIIKEGVFSPWALTDEGKAKSQITHPEIDSALNFLHSLEDNKENAAYIKTAIRWIANRSITLPQDNTKARQAFDLARKKHLDLQKYSTLGELITSPEMQPKEKEKAKFNPDEAKTFSNKRTVTTEGGRTFTVYDVENTEKGQRDVCKALAAHYEMSPWCLSTFTATGEPTESAKHFWEHYNAIPRKIAYEDGKPIAFSSSDTPMYDEAWWDMQDVAPQRSLSDAIVADSKAKYAGEPEGFDWDAFAVPEPTEPSPDERARDEFIDQLRGAILEVINEVADAQGIGQNYGARQEVVDMYLRSMNFSINEVTQEMAEGDGRALIDLLNQHVNDAFRYNVEQTIGQYYSLAEERMNTQPVAPMVEEEDILPFFLTPQGEIYGFADKNGDLYFDEEKVSPNVQIHEYTHLWDRAVAQRNPKLWKRGVALVKQTSLWNEVLNDTNYGQKWKAMKGMTPEKMESLIASEVHSRLTGTQGEALLNRIAKEKGSKGIVAKLKQWMLDFWKELKATFSNWSDEEINNLTLDDFNKMTVRDLVDKVNLKEEQSNQQTQQQNVPISYEGHVTPEENTVFVFGSNPKGIHGAGAAAVAKSQFGAIQGQGEGLQDHAYAIPTKDLDKARGTRWYKPGQKEEIEVKEWYKTHSYSEVYSHPLNAERTMNPQQIVESIKKMYRVAVAHPMQQFKVNDYPLGQLSLNGYLGEEMMQMFKDAGPIPSNVVFSKNWVDNWNESKSPKLGKDANVQQKFVPYPLQMENLGKETGERLIQVDTAEKEAKLEALDRRLGENISEEEKQRIIAEIGDVVNEREGTRVTLPNYQKNEMPEDRNKPILVDQEWKVSLLKELDAQITDDMSFDEQGEILSQMDRLLEAVTEEEYNAAPTKAQVEVNQKMLDYKRLNQQRRNLINNEVGLTPSEIRETAEQIVDSISDVITEIQQHPEKLKEYFPSARPKKTVDKSSRIEIVNTIGINSLIAYAKEKFDNLRLDESNPEVYEMYDSFTLLNQAKLISDNWEAMLRFASDVFVANEGFGIKRNAEKAEFEANERQYTGYDYDNYTDPQDEDAVREEHDEQEYWQLVMRTIDVMNSMSELIRQALHECYLKDVYGNKILSKFGIPKRVDKKTAVNQILRWTQGTLDINQMIEALKAKQSRNPWLEQLILRLEDGSGKESDFQSQFYGVMHRHFQLYSIGQLENDKFATKLLNKQKALFDVMNILGAKFELHSLPLFTIKGININNLNKLKEHVDALKKLMKPYGFKKVNKKITVDKDLAANDVEDAAKILNEVCHLIGHETSLDNIQSLLTPEMLYELSNQVENIYDSLEKQSKLPYEDYSPFKYDQKNGIGGAVKKFLSPIVEELQEVATNAIFEDGKLYQTYVIPSFLTQLFDSFAQNDEKFYNWVEKFYGFSEWFRTKDGRYRNPMLQILTNKDSLGTNAREIFDHMVQLTFSKHSYMQNMSPEEYLISVLTAYFSGNKTKKDSAEYTPAWLRVPIQSNKPSNEFIKFYTDRSTDYKNHIINGILGVHGGLFDIYLQEIDRIDTVRKRSEMKSSHISSFDKNGRRFQFVTFLNGYLKDDGKIVDSSWSNLIKNEDGTVDTDSNEKLTNLINQKVNAEHKLSAEDDAKLVELFSKAAKAFMDYRTEHILDMWDKSGILEAAKKVQDINDYGRSVRENLENFIWNDFFIANNFLQLAIADKAFYDGSANLQKRLSELHAPGVRGNKYVRDYKGNKVSDGIYRTILLKDFKGFVSTIIDNVAEVFDKMVTAAPEDEKKSLIALKEDLVRKPGTHGKDDKGGRYYRINVTDAQAYSSISSYRKKAFIFGKWSPKAEEIYNKLRNGETPTLSDLKVVFQPLKPFVYGFMHKNMGVSKASIQNMAVPFQAKNAEYLLIIADALTRNQNTSRPNLLKVISDVMEESERKFPTKGIDTVQFDSAIKSGGQGFIDIGKYIYDERGEVAARAELESQIYVKNEAGEIVDYNYDTFVQSTDYDNYALQQEVPKHFQEHKQAEPSQMRMNIPSDLDYYNYANEINQYTWKDDYGKEHSMNAKEIRKEWEKVHADKISVALNKLAKDLKLDSLSKKEQNIALSEILLDEIESSPRYGVDLMLACEVDDTTGEFMIPKGDPVQAKRIEQLVNSIIKNRVNKQEIAGGPIVQVSNFGTSRQLHIRFSDKNGNLLMTEEEYKNRNVDEALKDKNGKDIVMYRGYALTEDREAKNLEETIGHTAVDYHESLKGAIYFTSSKEEANDYAKTRTDKSDETFVRDGQTITQRNRHYTGDFAKTSAYKIKASAKVETYQNIRDYAKNGKDSDADVIILKEGTMWKDNTEYIVLNKDAVILPQVNQTYSQYIKENQAGIAYFEVFAPASMKKILKYFMRPDGSINIEAIEKVDPELLKMITGRIPNEDKYSIAHAKIVGFMPELAGEAMMFPYDLTEIDDSDFDVDKRYCQRKVIYIEAKDREEYEKELVEKGHELYKKQFKEDATINYIERMVSDLIDHPDKFKADSPFRKSLFNAYQGISYKTRYPQEGTVDARSNQIIDMSWAIMSNEMTAPKILNPGGFEIPKKGAYIIAAFKAQDGKVTFEELGKKSTDELKSLRGSDMDLAWVDTQIQYYKQNAAGSNLIGVFAVNKVAHATLEGDNILVDVKTLCGGKSFTIAGFTFGGKRNKEGKALMSKDEFERVQEKEGKTGIYAKTSYEEYLALNEEDSEIEGMMILDPTKDLLGRYIGKNIGQGIGASTDTAKDPWLDLVNINMITAGMFNAMLRLGMDWDDAALFMSQDVILRAIRSFNKKTLLGEKTTLDTIIADYVEVSMKNANYTEDSEINSQELTREQLEKGLLDKSKLSEDDIKDRESIDYKVLVTFSKLRTLTKAIKDGPTVVTRLNSIASAVGPLIIDNLILEHKLKKFTVSQMEGKTGFKRRNENGELEDIGTDEILELHPILYQFSRTFYSKNGSSPAEKMFRDMPAGCSHFKVILNALPKNIKDRIYDNRVLLSKLSDFYQSYMLVANKLINPDKIGELIRDFPNEFMGKGTDKNGEARKSIKEQYPDNAFIQAIQPDVNKKTKRVFLNIKTTGMLEQEKQRLRMAWTELDKVNHELSVKLFMYGFFRGGIGFSPKTWMSLVSDYVKQHLIATVDGKDVSYIETYRKFPTDKMVELVIIDQFVRNNWNDNSLAPIKGGENSKYDIDLKTGILTIRDPKEISDVKDERYIRTKEKQEIILWRKSPHATTKDLYFIRVMPLGNNGEYIEMSTDPNLKPFENLTSSQDNIESLELTPNSPIDDSAAMIGVSTIIEPTKSQQIKNLSQLGDTYQKATGMNSNVVSSLIDTYKEKTLNNKLTANDRKQITNLFEKVGVTNNEEEAMRMFKDFCK